MLEDDVARTQCHFYENKGKWTDEYQKWAINSPASYNIVKEFRGDLGDTTNPSQTTLKHFLFCGDSTMARLFSNLPFNDPSNRKFSTLKTGDRCGMMEYFGLHRAKDWVPPKQGLEGPCSFGLKNPFCTDCGGCDPTLKVSYVEEKVDQTYEYVAMEFSRDREFQTATASTSQETLGEYLGQTFPRHLCIVGTGAHDVILKVTVEQYAANVVDYINILKLYCKKVIWLQISASLDH